MPIRGSPLCSPSVDTMWTCQLYQLLATFLGCHPVHKGCSSERDKQRLMLVAFDLEDLETFLDALLPNVYPVMYDPERTTRNQLADLVLQKGSELCPASIAWANHGPTWGDTEHGDFYSWSWQIAKDDVITFDGQHLPQWRKLPGHKTGWPLIDAITAVLPSGGTVHLLGAEVGATPESRGLVQFLDKVTGLRWAASGTITEDDWELESRGRRMNVSHVYFDKEKISKWRGTTASFQHAVVAFDEVMWEEAAALTPKSSDKSLRSQASSTFLKTPVSTTSSLGPDSVQPSDHAMHRTVTQHHLSRRSPPQFPTDMANAVSG